MKPLNLTAQLNPKVVDGKVYFDLDALCEVLFSHCTEMSQLANDLRDPMLGLMVMGQTVLAQALDDVLGAEQAKHGLEVTGTPQRPADGHTEA
ncbi:hypothetical protein SEA_BILLNYE_225 [Streptomyces phage BillNye]|uniref:Uncharacterized protein n=1 Tax=Streptomyces phage BillNye TaxID=2079426 RepID=A0A2L1IW54_9CAUD|nr:hypothetical protein FDJ30_gp037 [Streptomyces phage BillNye]AVD99396.1 hypothetical protein SEA_BILLNYE_225 [Streptomyces phage BillNye]